MPPVTERSISAKTALGAAWLASARILTKGVDFITLLVLARFLIPADFGLVAVAMSVIFITEAAIDLPVVQAMVRISDVLQSHLDTAFTLSFLRSAIIALILGGLAYPFARFYGDMRLMPLLIVLALAPCARGLMSPRMVEYAKDINFSVEFVIITISKIAAFGVSTGIAVKTHSYWSIAAGTVTTPVVMLIASFFIAPYRPRFSLAEWRSLLGFLGWTSAAQAINALLWQCDRLILGRFVPVAVLGQFTMANDLATLPQQTLVSTLLRPAMSAFSLMQHDVVRLRAAYKKVSGGVLLIGMPAMLGMSLLAAPAVECVLGSGRWTAAIPILKLLALSNISDLFSASIGPLAMSMNRTRVLLSRSLIELAIKIPLVIVGAVALGLYGVIVARIVSECVMSIINMALVKDIIRISITEQIFYHWKAIVSSIIMGVFIMTVGEVILKIQGVPLLAKFLSEVLTASIVYLASVTALWWISGKPEGMESAVIAQLNRLQRRVHS